MIFLRYLVFTIICLFVGISFVLLTTYIHSLNYVSTIVRCKQLTHNDLTPYLLGVTDMDNDEYIDFEKILSEFTDDDVSGSTTLNSSSLSNSLLLGKRRILCEKKEKQYRFHLLTYWNHWKRIITTFPIFSRFR